MKVFLHIVVCFLAFASISASEPYITRCERKFDLSKAAPIPRHVREYMDLVVFPKVSLSGVPFAQAIKSVQEGIASHAQVSDPADRVGIGMFLKLREGVPESVSVSLHSATLPQVLDAICEQHGYVWGVEPFALSITPREDKPPVIHPRPPVPNHALQRTSHGD